MVLAHIYGLGELEELWNHPDVEEIDANGPDDVFVTFVGGRIKRWSSIAASDEEFLDLIRRSGPTHGRWPRCPSTPATRGSTCNCRTGRGCSPSTAARAPTGSGPRPTCASAVTGSWSRRRIRLVELGVWPQAASDFVVAAMRHGENVIVAGDWAAGKTTLLRALIYSAVQPWERIVTIEASITELGLHRSGRFENVVALFSRPPGPEGEGAVAVWRHRRVHVPPVERHQSDGRRNFG